MGMSRKMIHNFMWNGWLVGIWEAVEDLPQASAEKPPANKRKEYRN